jgi:hypothetical protein
MILKGLSFTYALAITLNNMAERHFRNRAIEAIYLIIDSEEIPDVIQNENIKGGGRAPTAKELEIHLVNGKIIKEINVEQLVLKDRPARDPERGLISKIKLSLTEMYMNEYYEGITDNFVTTSPTADRKSLPYPFLFLFYNLKPKVGLPADILDKKALVAALSGQELEILSS